MAVRYFSDTNPQHPSHYTLKNVPTIQGKRRAEVIVSANASLAFEDFELQGYGTRVYSDNSVYEGEWLGGDYHGKGCYTHSNGETFVGQYLHGEIWSGKGVFIYKSGFKYDGQFKQGHRHGQGIVTHTITLYICQVI